MTKEEAFKIFVKYGFKIYGGYSSKKIFDDPWYAQYWNTSQESYSHKRQDWMTDEVLDAFSWYLDQIGRDGGRGVGREKGLMSAEEMKQFEKSVEKTCEEKQHEKWNRERISKEKSDAKKMAHGLDLIKNMKPGEVYFVKFGRDLWGTRGILVQEVDPSEISGFYLDRVDKEVPMDAPEKEGYVYSRPNNWSKKKYEWDGKTFKKTRTYETKYVKFILGKVENAIIKK